MKKRTTKSAPFITPKTDVQVAVWRFNDHSVMAVIRGDENLAANLLRTSGATNMCVSGHETQVLLPIAKMHTYQKTLGLTSADLQRLERANWKSPDNPKFTSKVYPNNGT